MTNNTNPFAKYANNVATSASSNVSSAMVGLAPFKILGINPTEEQLVEIIGEGGRNFNTTYDLRENFNQVRVRPLTIWIQDVEERTSPTILNYDLGQQLVTSKKGKFLYFADGGNTSWAFDEASTTSWTKPPYVQCNIGQADWYSLVYKLVKWDQNDETPFTQFLTDGGIDFDTIYNGDFKGLHAFVEYINNSEHENFGTATTMFTAKVGDDNVRQRALGRNDQIFYNYGGVTIKQLEAYKKREADQKTAGYELTNDGYFIASDLDSPTLVPFDKKEHMKHIPDPTANLDDLIGV